jgi:DNA repair exonuclease SbcCD ATPase subunit
VNGTEKAFVLKEAAKHTANSMNERFAAMEADASSLRCEHEKALQSLADFQQQCIGLRQENATLEQGKNTLLSAHHEEMSTLKIQIHGLREACSKSLEKQRALQMQRDQVSEVQPLQHLWT